MHCRLKLQLSHSTHPSLLPPMHAVCVSMVSGVCSLRQQDGSGDGLSVRRLARLTAAFYVGRWDGTGRAGCPGLFGMPQHSLECNTACRGAGPDASLHFAALSHLHPSPEAGSTLLAIAVGIVLVVLVHPGRGAPFDHIASAAGGCRETHAQAVQGAGEGLWPQQVAQLVWQRGGWGGCQDARTQAL